MYEKGDADGYAAAYADNAAFTPSLQPFRVDGKAAIKDYFTTFSRFIRIVPAVHEAYSGRAASAR